MSDTPTEFSTVSDGEPSIPKAAARSSEGVGHAIQGKQLEPSIISDEEIRNNALPWQQADLEIHYKLPRGALDERVNAVWCTKDINKALDYASSRAIQQDIEQRRARIARKLEP